MHDLYTDAALVNLQVNRKRRAAAGRVIPRKFATLDTTDYLSDRHRDGLGYPARWRSYHPELIDSRRPNLMDNYYMFTVPHLCRLDRLTHRFLRDRICWKLGR